MAHTTLLRCVLVGLGLYLALASDLWVDLRTGQWTGGDNNLTWEVAPYQPPVSLGQQCSWRALLKMTFHKKERRRAEIKMVFANSTLFSFNLGDSITNDGWGGDDGTQSNDAEVHAYNERFIILGRDRPAGASYGVLYLRGDYLHGNLTMNVKDRFVEAVNDAGVVQYDSKELFALKGQADRQGETNYDLYLAMNRAIKDSPYRLGAGLCSVHITWHKR